MPNPETRTFGAVPGDRRRTDRRRKPTPMLSWRSLVGGRRVGDRRRGSDSTGYVDRYEPWLAAVLVAIGALCAVDAIFTLLYLQKGGEEANPLMDALIGVGPQWFVLVKCTVTNVGLAILCLHKNFTHVKIVITSLLGVYVLLFLYHLYLAAVVP